MELSVVIPVHNEQNNLRDLLGECDAALSGAMEYEVIVVDDASDDETLTVLQSLQAAYPWLRVIQHQKNCGQSAAIVTGVKAARASWIATLDGDGQNDPADIISLLRKLASDDNAQGLCAVVGYRRKRHDSYVKRFSSRVANAVRSTLLGDGTPDTGCGLKVFSRKAFLELPYFDHMHRFLPALLQREGGRVESVEVRHRARNSGKSHYGVGNRLWVGIVDLLGVMWLQRRNRRPVVKKED